MVKTLTRVDLEQISADFEIEHFSKVSRNDDSLVKSLQVRHSRERGSPEVVDFPGFPRSRE